MSGPYDFDDDDDDVNDDLAFGTQTQREFEETHPDAEVRVFSPDIKQLADEARELQASEDVFEWSGDETVLPTRENTYHHPQQQIFLEAFQNRRHLGLRDAMMEAENKYSRCRECLQRCTHIEHADARRVLACCPTQHGGIRRDPRRPLGLGDVPDTSVEIVACERKGSGK
ncbi:hypothetical protein LTR56_018951 [Elasticomyces elasticus]|nr:hypothetical protein LTR56_018951 [Elasticomyces elasticus]KAK3649890.1 hypothetical protein LTR22_012766 [Elasticomyces elasticus]